MLTKDVGGAILCLTCVTDDVVVPLMSSDFGVELVMGLAMKPRLWLWGDVTSIIEGSTLDDDGLDDGTCGVWVTGADTLGRLLAAGVLLLLLLLLLLSTG